LHGPAFVGSKREERGGGEVKWRGEEGERGRGRRELYIDFVSDGSSFDFSLFCDFICRSCGSLLPGKTHT